MRHPVPIRHNVYLNGLYWFAIHAAVLLQGYHYQQLISSFTDVTHLLYESREVLQRHAGDDVGSGLLWRSSNEDKGVGASAIEEL